MSEFVKVNVKEVLELFTILERDISELDNTNKNINIDREYSQSLKKSISGEIEKLEFIKSNLLGLEIDVPKKIYLGDEDSSEKNINSKNKTEKKLGAESFETKPKKKNKY